MSTALVRRIEWVASTFIFNPEWVRDVEETRVKIEACLRGEADYEATFGPAVGIEELEAMIDNYCNEARLPRRYRLPKHLHWMGER